MLDHITETIQSYSMLQAGDMVLCAVSGGADSAALLCALLSLRDRLGVKVCACHVNHQLRGAEADRDENFVRALFERLAVPFQIERRNVAAYAKMHKLGTEEAARDVRYQVLRASARVLGANKIALAHTLDDNLETMLFHLARGAGPQGLGGIPPVRDELIRPLIDTTRAQVESYLFDIHQPYVNDSSNESADYTRNRIRREVIPVLRQINPRCVEAAGRSARLLRKDEEYLAAQADMLRQDMVRETEAGIHLDCKSFALAPDVLRGRILRSALHDIGMPMSACTIALIRQLTAFAMADRPDGELSLPGGLTAVRQYNDLFLGALLAAAPAAEIPLRIGSHEALWENGTVISVCAAQTEKDFNKTFNTFAVDCGKIDFGTLCVRTRKQGDALQLTQTGGHRTLKRLMIDRHIPRLTRDRLAVVADKNGVIAVQGIGMDYSRRAQGIPALLIQFEGIDRKSVV